MKRNGIQFSTKYSKILANTPIPRTSLTEITGNKRVLIEHHKGIGAYSSYEIHVHTRYGYICVEGAGLLLECISCEQIVITGEISCVKFVKEACHDRKSD